MTCLILFFQETTSYLQDTCFYTHFAQQIKSTYLTPAQNPFLFHPVCFKGIKRETAEEIEFGNYNIFEDSKDAFATMNTSYDETKFDRLTKLMEFNVKNNRNVILDTIKRTI